MCLGVPMLVTTVSGDEAEVSLAGLTRRVSLLVCDEPPAPGDYVIVHAGFAIRRLDADQARETLDLLRQALPELEQ